MKNYEDAVKALNGALLKKQANHGRIAVERFARPGWLYGALLGGSSVVAKSTARDKLLNALFVEGRYPSDEEKRTAAMLRGTGNALAVPAVASIAAELAAPVVAAITPTRTKEEQEAHDKRALTADLLIPGVASYNKWKRLGALAAQKKIASGIGMTSEQREASVAQQSTADLKKIPARTAAALKQTPPDPEVPAGTPEQRANERRVTADNIRKQQLKQWAERFNKLGRDVGLV